MFSKRSSTDSIFEVENLLILVSVGVLKSVKFALKKPPLNVPTFTKFHPCFAKFRHFSRENHQLSKTSAKMRAKHPNFSKLRYF
jgi:hypothetical protein